MSNWIYKKETTTENDNTITDTYRISHAEDHCSDKHFHTISLSMSSENATEISLEEINHPHVFGLVNATGHDFLSLKQKRWLTSNFKVSKFHTTVGEQLNSCKNEINVPLLIKNGETTLRKVILIFDLNCLVHFHFSVEIDGNSIS